MGFWGFYPLDEDTPGREHVPKGESGMISIQEIETIVDVSLLLSRKGPNGVDFVSRLSESIGSIDQEPGALLSPYWLFCGFGRIDAMNVTIVFSAGLFNTNLRQPGRQGQ